jgi:LemA protein
VIWVILAIVLIVVGGFFLSYNKLVGLRQLTRNAWSDVDIYLKRRAELVPNLVASVKGYAEHEQNTLERTIEARNQALGASNLPARADAEQQVTSGVSRVLMLAENYPQLKASENFLELQRSLSETEKLIASARQYYNACVRDYNTTIEAFPSSIAANAFAFKPAEFFEVESASERNVPSIQGLP